MDEKGFGEWDLFMNVRTLEHRAGLVGHRVFAETNAGIVIDVDSIIWEMEPDRILEILRDARTYWGYLQDMEVAARCVGGFCFDATYQQLEDEPDTVDIMRNIDNNPLAHDSLKAHCKAMLLGWEQSRTLESPIEQQFWLAWMSLADAPQLTPQHEVLNGKYRIDFAHILSMTAIELDSFQWHHNRKQFARDRKRERELQKNGWRVIRFSGQEIHEGVEGCVKEVVALIQQAMETPTD